MLSDPGATPPRPAGEWLLLLFFLPSAKAGVRVQAWRRLQRSGAILLNNSAYVLPQSPESREDFEWIRSEIMAHGGEATILIARTADASAQDAIADLFRAARRQEFRALMDEAATLMTQARSRRGREHSRGVPQRIRRLRERFDAAARLDFFGTPERLEAASVLARLGPDGQEREAMNTEAITAVSDYRHKRWLTRPRPGVDRMSSAWLIRRFIDPRARFVFSSDASVRGTIPFDTFGAEFGHHGDHCTFETLAARFGVTDSTVARIARIVHDLDLKERHYREPSTETIGRLVEGLRHTHTDDDALLSAGIELFNALYHSLTEAPGPAVARKKGVRTRQSSKHGRKGAGKRT